MAQERKTPAGSAARGVVLDLAERRRELESADASAKAADATGVSDDAREFARARRGREASPEVRAERVAELKAQIAKGTYQPDPEEVARKLLEHGF